MHASAIARFYISVIFFLALHFIFQVQLFSQQTYLPNKKTTKISETLAVMLHFNILWFDKDN